MSLPSRAAASFIRLSTCSGSTPTSTRTRESPSSFTVVSMARRTLEDGTGLPARALRRSSAERVEAWAVTGPPGRVWCFAADAAAAVPMLVRYWGGRLGRGHPPEN